MESQQIERTKVFISYSHKDDKCLKDLIVHLKSLEYDEGIDVWNDTKLKGGDLWQEEIARAIAVAKVAVLLISADFLASEFIRAKELPLLLDAAVNDGATIIPLIVRPSRFSSHPSLNKFNAVNRVNNPLSRMGPDEYEQTLVELTEQIASALRPQQRPSQTSLSSPVGNTLSQPSIQEQVSRQKSVASRPGVITAKNVSRVRNFLTLHGHTQQVNSVAFSNNSKSLASGSNDKTARLWDARSGGTLKIIDDHESEVNAVAFTLDDKILLTASSDGQVVLRAFPELKTEKWLQYAKPWFGGLRKAKRLSFSRDRHRLVVGMDEGMSQVWKIPELEAEETIEAEFDKTSGGANELNDVALSPDGLKLALGLSNQRIQIWDVKAIKLVVTLEGHTGGVSAVAYAPDGKRLASGSEDKTVKLWDANGMCLHTLEGHKGSVNSVAFAPRSPLLASSSDDHTICLWQYKEGSLLQKLKGHKQKVTTVRFSADGKMLASGSSDGAVRLWKVT
jgi:WD40 repeat protein